MFCFFVANLKDCLVNLELPVQIVNNYLVKADIILSPHLTVGLNL